MQQKRRRREESLFGMEENGHNENGVLEMFRAMNVQKKVVRVKRMNRKGKEEVIKP